MIEPSSSVFESPMAVEEGPPRGRLVMITVAVGTLALLAGLTGSLLTRADATGAADRSGDPSVATQQAPIGERPATPGDLTSEDGDAATVTPSTTAPVPGLEVIADGGPAVAPSAGGGTGGDGPTGVVRASPASPTTIAPPATTIPPTTAPPVEPPADGGADADADTGTDTGEDDG